MSHVRCEVSEGPRPGFKTVEVRGVEGRAEVVAVEEKVLAAHDGQYLLPVRVVGVGRGSGLTLVQLPAQAGVPGPRVWVQATDLTRAPDEVSA